MFLPAIHSTNLCGMVCHTQISSNNLLVLIGNYVKPLSIDFNHSSDPRRMYRILLRNVFSNV